MFTSDEKMCQNLIKLLVLVEKLTVAQLTNKCTDLKLHFS